MKRRHRSRWTRRDLFKFGVVAGGAKLPKKLWTPHDDDKRRRSRVSFTPFTRQLPIPEELQGSPVLPSVLDCSDTRFKNPPCKLCPEWGSPVFYDVTMRKEMVEIVPNYWTEIWGYNGKYPGPTFRARKGEPTVVRFRNDLDVECSIHNHGGHTAPESDGFPDAFIFPGDFKDYIYPNISPGDTPAEQDAEFASTQWYHDHAMDITGQNVLMGLAGFYLLTDHIEENLIGDGVLPNYNEYDLWGQPFDIPIVIQDRLFASDGSLIYDTFDHDGFLGDIFVCNGKAQPFVRVQRAKYRFRFLNGSNARFYEFKLSSGSFLQVGNDSWLLGEVVPRSSFSIAPAERADMVIDFRNAPSEVFLENILEQTDGQGPEGRADRPTPILKFIVDSGPAVDTAPGCVPGAPLRPHIPILKSEIVRTREFEFDREHGAWVINDRFFDPDRDNADPVLGTAERWILEGGSGWAHPIHIHLEAHQIQSKEGKKPPLWESFKKDTVQLTEDQEEVEIFIKFRTFPGRFVFHCHNVEHEDMRMMGVFNVKGAPFVCGGEPPTDPEPPDPKPPDPKPPDDDEDEEEDKPDLRSFWRRLLRWFRGGEEQRP